MNTPPKIYSLEPNQIFVFGSNLAGRHGRGAAKDALKFGAVHGKGSGLHGQTYAIPTKDRNIKTLPLPHIQGSVDVFIGFASACPNLQFLVTEIGCGLAGYKPEQIAPMFANAPGNVVLPESFTLLQ